jgi:hypothetical protein
VVSRRVLTTETRVQSQVIRSKRCVRKGVIDVGFSQSKSISDFLCQLPFYQPSLKLQYEENESHSASINRKRRVIVTSLRTELNHVDNIITYG